MTPLQSEGGSLYAVTFSYFRRWRKGAGHPLNHIVQKALTIARQRSETLGRLKAALEKGQDAEALRIARELCGLDPHRRRARRSATSKSTGT